MRPREYANGPIWACSRYRRNCAVPVRLTQYCADTTCNLPALNECGDATSPKTPPPMNQLRNGHAPAHNVNLLAN